MNRRSSHAVPLSENECCQLAALDQALRCLLRPSLPQSCGWPPLRSDQLFEEILLCVILHADWLSRLEGHSCIIFMATKKNLRTIGDSLPLRVMLLVPIDQGTQGNKERIGISLWYNINTFGSLIQVNMK